MLGNLWRDVFYPYLSPVLFVLCLPQPAVIGENGHALGSSTLLMVGWITISWWANPLYLTALALGQLKARTSLYIGIAAFGCASSALLTHKIPIDGRMEVLAEFGWGYYFWLMAMAVQILRQASLFWPGQDRMRSLILLVVNVALLGLLSEAFLHQSTHALDFSACHIENLDC